MWSWRQRQRHFFSSRSFKPELLLNSPRSFCFCVCLQCVALCCYVCAVCCSVSQCIIYVVSGKSGATLFSQRISSSSYCNYPRCFWQCGRHCNTLQSAKTHFSTLQHTATHCNTHSETATQCNSLPHNATHCNTL